MGVPGMNWQEDEPGQSITQSVPPLINVAHRLQSPHPALWLPEMLQLGGVRLHEILNGQSGSMGHGSRQTPAFEPMGQ